jgi:hypothetical protein
MKTDVATTNQLPSAEETILSAARLPLDLKCIKCGGSIREAGGFVVTLSEVIRRDTTCTALCNRCIK